ncbi:hypothetical protein F1640_18565 [Novosphingobium sp. NBM11]|uniref:hypothetical protein n=1 Tax=Novosphingobium sp. NBM11 TaxID=2596914 RepID=UPI0018922C72|nr:hypothetical protein [Novosphingobium sp. NBM11]MBF5091959.1 hypothetical protein [Novosphingobium sp. NBM11]
MTHTEQKITLLEVTAPFLEGMRRHLAPIFDQQRETWQREGPAALAEFDATGATLDTIGGNCPVQAEGDVDGHRFYFRARGAAWQFHVARTDDEIFSNPVFYREEGYGEYPQAGWMPEHEAIGFIVDSIAQFRAGRA